MGFGDFLRGSLACHQMCYKYGVKPEIDFSQHAIGNYLIPSHTIDTSKFDFVDACNIGNYSTLDLRNLIVKKYRFSYLARNINNICVYTNVYPKFPISHETQQFVKQSLIPTTELNDIIPSYSHEYEVVHIRSGDIFAFNTAIDHCVDVNKDIMIKNIIETVGKIIKLATCPIMIISDSFELKNILTQEFKTLESETEPSHMTLQNCNAVDTLIDYFTLTRARKIHQFSVYNWGSGFSDTVNWIFNVPLEKYQLAFL